MCEPDETETKLKAAFQRVMEIMPGAEELEVMTTHAQRRAVVHLKLADRLSLFLAAVRESYAFVPPALGMDISNKGQLFLNVLEELGECVRDVGTDTMAIGSAYMSVLDEVKKALE